MATRTYSTFYPGVQQDDYLTNGANFIEHKNIDGLRDGYGVTLGPKVNKQLTTNGAMIGLAGVQLSTGATDRIYLGGDDGEIYTLDSTDNTPEHTLSATKHIVQVVRKSNDLYFFWKSNKASANIGLAYITESDASTGTWGAMNETLEAEGQIQNRGVPPVLIVGNSIFVGGDGQIKTLSSSGYGGTVFSFPDSDVVGFALQGSTIIVYCDTGNIYFWDGGSTTENARQYLGSRISRTGQKAGLNYVVTEDGQMWLGSGYQFIRASKPKKSNRMNNNSSYDTRLDFTQNETNELNNHTIISASDDTYFYSSDTIPGIYKYGKLIPGMQDGFHKIITQNNAGTQIDMIYDLFYYERDKKLYFSYKADTTYGVDYIDFTSLETCEDAYMITDVFSGGTSLKKELERIRRATSNTSGNNYIKLYYRVNNGDWELLRTVNDATDTIERENIATYGATNDALRNFVDVQFKIELHNDTGAEDAPTLHELMNEYFFIET